MEKLQETFHPVTFYREKVRPPRTPSRLPILPVFLFQFVEDTEL